MKGKSLIVVFILAVLKFSAYAADEAAYTLKVENFSSLTVVDGIGVDYYCNADSAGWVVFTAAPEMASKVSFSNNKDHLRIQTMADEKQLTGLPRVKVYSASLKYAENSGDSLLCVHLTEPMQKFTVKQIGNGTIAVKGLNTTQLDGSTAAGRGFLKLQGEAGKAKFNNVGTGSIDASELKCGSLSCFILGPGIIEVKVEGRLKVTGAGSGKVINHIKPEKTTNRSIGIKVEEAGEKPS